ncbi:MAG: hypothetical protein A3J28_16440 [Acidobacteria bacterium RIFCSPLOWO2_12_FULL_60_22]|nr:MAG: hypothetical protein A3J28_16440 [Acidobacteria bacterium RIFCSPLOWO2_12_FULL_60_22]
MREEVLSRLRGYAFRSVEHQVLFDCLRALPSDRPDLIRSLLPERLVRAGFPDFDLTPFFEPHGLSAPEARELCQKLMESQSGERNAAIGKPAAEILSRWYRGPERRNSR